MRAPAFSLPDQNNTSHSLEEYRGRYVVLYFYPKDDTPGCTKEACSIRDSWDTFAAARIAVVGISADTPASHKKFAEKHHLPFTLLSDRDKSVVKAYGAWGKKKFMGREFEGILRNTYVIDPTGEIIHTFEDVTPADHGAEIISWITEHTTT